MTFESTCIKDNILFTRKIYLTHTCKLQLPLGSLYILWKLGSLYILWCFRRCRKGPVAWIGLNNSSVKFINIKDCFWTVNAGLAFCPNHYFKNVSLACTGLGHEYAEIRGFLSAISKCFHFDTIFVILQYFSGFFENSDSRLFKKKIRKIHLQLIHILCLVNNNSKR